MKTQDQQISESNLSASSVIEMLTAFLDLRVIAETMSLQQQKRHSFCSEMVILISKTANINLSIYFVVVIGCHNEVTSALILC